MGKKDSVQGMALGKLDVHRQKRKSDLYFTSYTKVNSKWVKVLNIRPVTVKLLEENRRKAS